MTEDEYDKFLDKNFSCTMENRDIYDEIAEDWGDRVNRIYLEMSGGGLYWWLFIILIVFVFLSFIATILGIIGFYSDGKPVDIITIQNVAGNIFTAFIALLGLLAVFFVFKTESQRDRSGKGINTMVDLFEKGHRKKEVKSEQAKSTTKEMIRFFHGYIQEKEELKEKLWKSWIYTVNQLYISHVNRDYFLKNVFLFITVILLSLLLMVGFEYPGFIEGTLKKYWNPVWFSLDIVLAFISIVYLFHTLMVMIKHVYLKEDLKRIHKSERGMWGPYKTIGNYESHMEIKKAVGICPKCKGKKRLELKQVFNSGQGIGNNLLVLCSDCNTNKLTQKDMEGFISKRSDEVKNKIREILEKRNFHF